MTDKKAEALEALTKVSKRLLEKTVEGDLSVQDVASGLYSLVGAMQLLVEEKDALNSSNDNDLDVDLDQEEMEKYLRDTSDAEELAAHYRRHPQENLSRAAQAAQKQETVDTAVRRSRELWERREFLGRVMHLVSAISYKDPTVWKLRVSVDEKDPEGRVYLQVLHQRPDVRNPELVSWGNGGKSYLSPHMTDSEIVRKAFQLFMAYEEHECREWFKYGDKAVFGPHISVDALWEVADDLDVRDG